MNPYRVLNVRIDATAAEIKAAFITLSRTLHPDLSGEDSAVAFAELKTAYDILRDPEKRRKWDTTGTTSGESVSITDRANAAIVGLILSALENPTINDTISIVELVKQMVQREKAEGEKQLAEINKHIKVLEKRVTKLTTSQKDARLLPLIQIAAQNRIDVLHGEIHKVQDALNLKQEILRQLATLDYEAVVSQAVATPYFSFNTAGYNGPIG